MISKGLTFQSVLALCAFVAVSADHNYLLGNIFLGASCSGNPVHYYAFGYDMVGDLNKPTNTPCNEWVSESGATGYGSMEITGANPVSSGTGAYMILGKKFGGDNKCAFESYEDHDVTAVITGQCLQIFSGSYSVVFEYHDTAPQLPSGQEFVVEAFYESKATCLADNVPASKLTQYSEGRAFSLDACIPISASFSGMYTSKKMLKYYASPDCTGTPAETLGPLSDVIDKCDSQKDTDTYPGSWESGISTTYARHNLYHYEGYVKMSAKEGPKMPKGGAKSKAKN